jgi:hypothetical protein
MKKRSKRLRKARIDRGAFIVSTLKDAEQQDREYWAKQTPQTRLRAMELMRQINYGKAASGRLQRFFEVVQLEHLA